MAGGSDDPQHPFTLPDGTHVDWAGYQQYLDSLAPNTQVTVTSASGQKTTMSVGQYRTFVAGEVASTVKAIQGQMTLDITTIRGLSRTLGGEVGPIHDIVHRLGAAVQAANIPAAMGAGTNAQGQAVTAQSVPDITGDEVMVPVVDLSGVANNVLQAWSSLQQNLNTLAGNLNNTAGGLTTTADQVLQAENASLSGFGGKAVDPGQGGF